jgi:hypothetical protein
MIVTWFSDQFLLLQKIVGGSWSMKFSDNVSTAYVPAILSL